MDETIPFSFVKRLNLNGNKTMKKIIDERSFFFFKEKEYII
jgi:hypothetical protein